MTTAVTRFVPPPRPPNLKGREKPITKKAQLLRIFSTALECLPKELYRIIAEYHELSQSSDTLRSWELLEEKHLLSHQALMRMKQWPSCYPWFSPCVGENDPKLLKKSLQLISRESLVVINWVFGEVRNVELSELKLDGSRDLSLSVIREEPFRCDKEIQCIMLGEVQDIGQGLKTIIGCKLVGRRIIPIKIGKDLDLETPVPRNESTELNF